MARLGSTLVGMPPDHFERPTAIEWVIHALGAVGLLAVLSSRFLVTDCCPPSIDLFGLACVIAGAALFWGSLFLVRRIQAKRLARLIAQTEGKARNAN